MALVGYSDSEASDSDSPHPPPPPKPASKSGLSLPAPKHHTSASSKPSSGLSLPAPKNTSKPASAPAPSSSTAQTTSTSTSASATKPAFQKLTTSSGKIAVSLPSLSTPVPSTSTSLAEEEPDGAPPAKKARTGGGSALSGFNALLPAPKGRVPMGAKGGGVKLGRGVSLKTGSEAMFSREAAYTAPVQDYEVGDAGNEDYSGRDRGTGGTRDGSTEGAKVVKEEEEVKLVGKPMMFKPLSVTNKAKKKKPVSATAMMAATEVPKKEQAPAAPPPKPKVSLFGNVAAEPSLPAAPPSPPPVAEADAENAYFQEDTYPPPSYETPSSQAPGAPNLNDIATELNLSASERRQLFGRAGRGDALPTSLLQFNTDAEYAANEALRAAGQTVQHNPVRGIAPGKHSLQQLVNAATNQKEALEEHFASGKRNKKEAGSRYGW